MWRSPPAAVGSRCVRGKGDAYREVPLNSASRQALDDWFHARVDQLAVLAEAGGAGDGAPPALWLSR